MIIKGRNLVINMIKLPILLVGYVFLVLLSILLPKKYITRIFSFVHIEKDITEIINNKLYLKTFAFIVTLVIYIIYKNKVN